MNELNDLLAMIGEFFIEKFRDELAIQGHDATGTLFNTMRYEIQNDAMRYNTIRCYTNTMQCNTI